jgi:hypothetical protein
MLPALPRRCERLGPLGTAHAEPDNLRTLTAVIETPTDRAESAIWNSATWFLG